MTASQTISEVVGAYGECAMVDKFIAQLNIAHFREKLATEQDATKRQMLLRLLGEEEAKLAAALDDPPEEKRPGA